MMAEADKTKIGKELNELSWLIEDVTIPYKGAKGPAKSRPGGARKKSGGTAGSEQALVADQIKLETIRGENLAKEVELSRLKLELAKVESQQSSPISSSPINQYGHQHQHQMMWICPVYSNYGNSVQWAYLKDSRRKVYTFPVYIYFRPKVQRLTRSWISRNLYVVFLK